MPQSYNYENCKLEKGPTDKAKDPDPGGSDQQNLGHKKLENRKADRTVGLMYIYFPIFRQARPVTKYWKIYIYQSNRTVSLSVFQFHITISRKL